jgi:KUP system potassium uptake protein
MRWHVKHSRALHAYVVILRVEILPIPWIALITYFVGHETVVHREDGNDLPHWQEALFAMMERNATHVSDFFNMPSDQVVEIGRQVTI